MLNVIFSGVVTGLLYAVTGLALVVVYRTSKVLNFAIGGMGALAAYTVVELLGLGLPYWIVFPLGIAVGAAAGALVEVGVARPLRTRPHLTVALGTLGALLIYEGALGTRFGYAPTAVQPVLANAGAVRVGSATVSANQLFIVAASLLATGALVLLFQKTRVGLSMRATTSGPQTSELLGVNVSAVRLLAWSIGGAYGALAASLVAPLTYLAPQSFTTFLLTAFVAVVIGGFTSITGVVVGAVAFGVVINVLVVYLDASLTLTYTFFGITLLLLFRPYGLFGRKEHEIPEPRLASSHKKSALKKNIASTARRRLRLPTVDGAPPQPRQRTLPFPRYGFIAAAAAAAALAALPLSMASGSNVLFLLTVTLATFVGLLGLNIIAGYSGQVSLAHSAFLALGAYVTAIAIRQDLPPLAGLFLALGAGAAVGLLLGLPATRLSGVYLLLLTLVFAYTTPELIYYFSRFTGGGSGLPVPRPNFLSDARSMYLFVLVIAALSAVVVYVSASTRLGRGWRAVRDNEEAARALGTNSFAVKLGAFTLGSALAALSGGLGASLVGFVGPESYGIFISIYAILAIVLGGFGSVLGSLIGAAFITFVPVYLDRFGVPQSLAFGLVLVAVLLFAPNGVAGLLREMVTRVVLALDGSGRRSRSRPHKIDASGSVTGDSHAVLLEEPVVEKVGPGSAGPVVDSQGLVQARPLHFEAEEAGTKPSSSRTSTNASPLLALRRVSADYGGEPIVDGIDLIISEREVVALLGANGAGKSTILRAISGVIPVSKGSVSWCGEELTGLAPHSIAHRGIAHVPEGRAIFPDLSVDENLTMGTFSLSAAARRGGREADRDEVFNYFPVLRNRLMQRAGTLSGGEQQMLAISRALLGRPRLLILDEPSLGLAPVIGQQLFGILGDISRSGMSILLVEQNAHAALKLADRAYVLRGGRMVLAGEAQEVLRDPRLSDTYLSVQG